MTDEPTAEQWARGIAQGLEEFSKTFAKAPGDLVAIALLSAAAKSLETLHGAAGAARLLRDAANALESGGSVETMH